MRCAVRLVVRVLRVLIVSSLMLLFACAPSAPAAKNDVTNHGLEADRTDPAGASGRPCDNQTVIINQDVWVPAGVGCLLLAHAPPFSGPSVNERIW